MVVSLRKISQVLWAVQGMPGVPLERVDPEDPSLLSTFVTCMRPSDLLNHF